MLKKSIIPSIATPLYVLHSNSRVRQFLRDKGSDGFSKTINWLIVNSAP